jgi:hypothetical protein
LSHITEITEDKANSELEYEEVQGSGDQSEVNGESVELVDNDDSVVEVNEPKWAVKKYVKQAKQKHGWSTNNEAVGESDGDADGELIIDRLNQYLTHILYLLQ